MLIPLQIRCGRILAGMSQHDLALRAGVGIATIKRIEAEGRSIAGTAKTIARLQNALESAGVRFIEQTSTEGPGVRLANPVVVVSR